MTRTLQITAALLAVMVLATVGGAWALGHLTDAAAVLP